MAVYIEYAIAENFLLDGLLLYLALKCARAKVKAFRLLLAAAIGAAEAVCFPLLSLPAWCAVLIKLFGGLILCLVAVSKGTKKTYLLVTAAFFGMTFLLGGLLIAIDSALGIEYVEGEGYLLESVPVALVISVAGIFSVLAVRGANAFYRYRKIARNLFDCKLTAGGKTATVKGFADTGNCLFFRGEPVCVISAIGALALFSKMQPEGRMTVSTVNGSKEAPVFRCPRLEIGGSVRENVCFTVGEIGSKEYQIILHTAFAEGADESTACFKSLAQKIRGK